MRPVDHLRAAFVAFHLAAVVAMALPAPIPSNVKRIATPKQQAALAPWREALAALGYPLSPDEFTALAQAIGERWIAFDAGLNRLFRPYVRCCGTPQSWSMFGSFEHTPGRLDVAVHEDGAWRTLYGGVASDARWRAGQLEQERFRGLLSAFGTQGHRMGWTPFVSWVVGHAAADFPAADRVRVRMVQTHPDDPAIVRRTGEVPEGDSYWTRDLPMVPP